MQRTLSPQSSALWRKLFIEANIQIKIKYSDTLGISATPMSIENHKRKFLITSNPNQDCVSTLKRV